MTTAVTRTDPAALTTIAAASGKAHAYATAGTAADTSSPCAS